MPTTTRNQAGTGDQTFTIAETLLAEFDNEARMTRRFLERIPADKLTWKPHEKSMTAGQLALHIAASPGLGAQVAALDSAPVPDFTVIPQPASFEEIIEAFDQSLEVVRTTLRKIDDRQMQSDWQIVRDGKVLLSMPRTAFLRYILVSHTYNHRGQFGVYLRLLGAKVPATLGPSADELPDFLQ